MSDTAQIPPGGHVLLRDQLRDQFEYKVDTKKRMIIAGSHYSEAAMQADLNDYGKDGWEVITIASAIGDGMQHTQFIMKRRIAGTRP